MKKLIAAAALAAALVVPAVPAAATEAGPPAGIRPCGPMQFGFVVWYWDPITRTQQDLVAYCVPIGP